MVVPKLSLAIPSCHMRPFDVVAHADWSLHPAKRWVAVATRAGGAYRVEAPVPAPIDLVESVRARGGGGHLFLGLDVPLGVPAAWGAVVGVGSFRSLLDILARDEERAASFFSPATRPEDISPWRPFYPARPGGARQARLLAALGLTSMDQLLRRCDRATAERGAAGALFWTLGPKQPGKAAISAWREVLLPALASGGDQLGLWPFDGGLAALSARRAVIAEAYPAELGLRLGLPAPGRGWSKRRPADRVRQGRALLGWSGQHGVELAEGLRGEIANGFGEEPTGEDRFDAVVGVLGMLAALEREVRHGSPAKGDALEGWMLGLVS